MFAAPIRTSALASALALVKYKLLEPSVSVSVFVCPVSLFQVTLPEPSVFKTCPFVPSAIGNVHAPTFTGPAKYAVSLDSGA